jgi:hypothetical protein
MFRRITLPVLTIGLLIALTPGISSATHDDCVLSVEPPGNYLNIAVIATAQLECDTEQKVIHFSINLTRDGVVVDESQRKCHKADLCWSFLFENDAQGDQVWCVEASARIGGHRVESVERCESDPSI